MSNGSQTLAEGRMLRNLNDLRQYVNEILCELNQLEVGAFPLTEKILLQRGLPCGVQFCLHGPRNVRLTAIWENVKNSVLFYDSAGLRTCRVQLDESPCLEWTACLN